MTKLEILFCISRESRWTTLHLYCPETKGYSTHGGSTYGEIIGRLLQYPIERNATYRQVSKKQLEKIYGGQLP